MKSVLIATSAAFFALPVWSAGWTVDDLGSMAERSACISRSEKTFQQYFKRHGGTESYGSAQWTVAGYGLRGKVIDAIIICPIEAGMVEPYMIVHNSDDNNDARTIVAERLKTIWKEH